MNNAHIETWCKTLLEMMSQRYWVLPEFMSFVIQKYLSRKSATPIAAHASIAVIRQAPQDLA